LTIAVSAEIVVVDVTRRRLLGAGAGGLAAASLLSAGARAASFGNPDEPPQAAVNATNPASLTDPGPHSAALADRFPAASSRPSFDDGHASEFNTLLVTDFCGTHPAGYSGPELWRSSRL